MMTARQGIPKAGLRLSILVMLVLLGSGCTAAAESLSPTAVVEVAAPSELPLSTNTPEPSATLEPIATATFTPPPACAAVTGLVQDWQIDSAVMPKPMQFNVYLPPCYDTAAQEGYPVLYLLHGQSSDQGQWLRLGAAEKADELISAEELPSFIIVMPFEEYSLRDPFTTGFGESLTDELVPWVDAHFNTCPQRACRAIGGLSRGGAWALHLGFSRWNLFGAIGAHSVPPFYGTGDRLAGWLEAIPAGETPRIYMDIGADDPYRSNAEEFEKRLTGYSVQHVWLLNLGNHVEEYWSAHIEQYLRWYWGRAE